MENRIKVALFTNSSPKDLEDTINMFLANPNIIFDDIKFSTCSRGGQNGIIFESYSALVSYEEA